MPDDVPDLRASHEDRDRVVDALRVAAGDGRLSAEELDTRLERALSARTLGELAGLTADLPHAPAAKEVLVIRQHAGKYVQEGRWLVPARIELHTQLCRVMARGGSRDPQYRAEVWLATVTRCGSCGGCAGCGRRARHPVSTGTISLNLRSLVDGEARSAE